MNIFRKNNNFRGKQGAYSLSSPAFMILRVGLPVILLYLALFLALLIHDGLPGYILAKKYAYTLEHIIMSATLITFGAMITDIAAKKR